MIKIKQFFEEEMSGEPLTQEKVEWALEKFAELAWFDGWASAWCDKTAKEASDDTVQSFLSKPYSERDQELVHINNSL
jgi:hypothetical protein